MHIARQVCRSLREAHGLGVIHRDLKPANIFVCRSTTFVSEHARVLDFGVSKLATGAQLDRHPKIMTTPGMVLGTPQYMAPEQMRGEDVDARADIYAFGVILYEVLSGEQPFQAESLADLLAQVLTETPRSLDCLAALPEGLAEIVAKAMAREPADRFDSMASLLEALAPFRAGREERRCDAPPSLHVLERAEMPRVPRRSNAGSMAAFVAALAFVVAGTWVTKRTPAEQALETSEAALQEPDLASQGEDPGLEPNVSPTAKIRELEAVADAREATKAARAPARPAIARRRATPASPAEERPSIPRANPSPDTLKERPITIQRLSNGLIDPFVSGDSQW
jgi:serine/threonine protein kinase